MAIRGRKKKKGKGNKKGTPIHNCPNQSDDTVAIAMQQFLDVKYGNDYIYTAKELKESKKNRGRQLFFSLNDRIYELFLSCSAILRTSFAIDENDLAVSCISVVFKLIPCQKKKKKKNCEEVAF